MLVVTSLGGGALGEHGQPLTPEERRGRARLAAEALAPLAAAHHLVIAHGSSPRPAGVDHDEHPATDLLAQEMRRLLPFDRPMATVMATVEVDPGDVAFHQPAAFVGPTCSTQDAERLTEARGWSFRPTAEGWRRVVPFPEPSRTVELQPIRWLVERNTIVIAAGGALPTVAARTIGRAGPATDCVVDHDAAAGLLARELRADLLVLLTGVDAVYADDGDGAPRAIRRAPPEAFAELPVAAGAIGPQVAAACRFAAATSRPAVIGALRDLDRLLTGQAGTTVSLAHRDVVFADAMPPSFLSTDPAGTRPQEIRP